MTLNLKKTIIAGERSQVDEKFITGTSYFRKDQPETFSEKMTK